MRPAAPAATNLAMNLGWYGTIEVMRAGDSVRMEMFHRGELLWWFEMTTQEADLFAGCICAVATEIVNDRKLAPSDADVTVIEETP